MRRAVVLCMLLLAVTVPVHAHHAAEHGAAVRADSTDAQHIARVMKQQFDRPEAPLTVVPVTIEGEHAMAGWLQDARGGRALLRRVQGDWMIVVCGGNGLLDAATLRDAGLTSASATRLVKRVKTAEGRLPKAQAQKLGLFEGVVKIGAQGHGSHGAAADSSGTHEQHH
jgi:hypothetical protein